MAKAIEPDEPRCLTCGYQLRNLPTAVCPECGRGFDLADPKSYDGCFQANRRRKLWRRIGLGAGLLVVLYVFVPRGVLRSSVEFTCPHCGEVVTVRRWELKSVKWLGFRYPGRSSVSRVAIPPEELTVQIQCVHDFSINVKAQGYMFVAMMAQWNSSADDPAYLDGFPSFPAPMLVTPETAGEVLKALTAKSNSGASVLSRSDLTGNP